MLSEASYQAGFAGESDRKFESPKMNIDSSIATEGGASVASFFLKQYNLPDGVCVSLHACDIIPKLK